MIKIISMKRRTFLFEHEAGERRVRGGCPGVKELGCVPR